MEEMKTTEEILYALECGVGGLVGDCKKCVYNTEDCAEQNSVDSAKLIRQLEHERNRFADENRALRTELKVNLGNEYWMNICKMNARQETKGLEKYGEPLEENTTLTTMQRIEHLQEELIDGLKYCEHLKATCNDGITANDYQRAAMRTDNKDQTEEERMLDALFGLCGEAGEVMDAYKKHRFQGHESYKDEMIIELSDTLWYAAKLADVLGVTLGEVMERNIEKLKKRFPEGFSKDRSVNREQ